jgi:hypothetical protein
MGRADVQETPSQAEMTAFRDRVAEGVSIARAAMTNAVTANVSVTMAIVGTAVTLATARFESTPVAKAMLFALAGAGCAAIVMLMALMMEAIRATRFAEKWRKLYVRFYELAKTGQPASPIPWDELNERLSVSIHWKISVPAFLLFAGLTAAVASMALDMKIFSGAN